MNKKYDGTNESFYDKSHKPLAKHPNAHTDLEIKWIKDTLKRSNNIPMKILGFLSPKKMRNKLYKLSFC